MEFIESSALQVLEYLPIPEVHLGKFLLHISIIMKYLEGRESEGMNEHHDEIFRRKEGRMKEGMSIMKYLEGRKEE